MTHQETTARARHEIEHGARLAAGDPERVWGWATPAGRHRAVRRGRLIAHAAGLAAGHKVLEVGCGTGLFTVAFAASGAEVLAVDISEDLLRIARRRPDLPPRVRFARQRFEDAGGDGPFDAVVGSSVLHHLELDTALRRIHDLLVDGGALSFAEPNLLNPQIAVQKKIGWVKRRLGDSPDETAYTRWHLARRLEAAGFVEVRVRPFDWLHPLTPRPLIGPVRALGAVLERMPGVREFAGSLLIVAKKATPGDGWSG